MIKVVDTESSFTKEYNSCEIRFIEDAFVVITEDDKNRYYDYYKRNHIIVYNKEYKNNFPYKVEITLKDTGKVIEPDFDTSFKTYEEAKALINILKRSFNKYSYKITKKNEKD